MTVKTLEYIHKLLIEREAAARAEHDMARTEYDAAIKRLRDNDLTEFELGKAVTAGSCMKAHSEARDALKDFESVEW